MGCICPEPPEDVEGFPPTPKWKPHALCWRTTLPSNGYAHAMWMPYAPRWGKTKAKTSLGAGRGRCLLLFVFVLPLFEMKLEILQIYLKKGRELFSLCDSSFWS